jgi:hypothetical protein
MSRIPPEAAASAKNGAGCGAGLIYLTSDAAREQLRKLQQMLKNSTATVLLPS